MKIKLEVSRERDEEIRAFLTAHGIEVDDDAPLVLHETDRYPDRLSVRRRDTGEKVLIAAADVVFAEAFGHEVVVHTTGGAFVTAEPLGRLLAGLDPTLFCRVSNSVFVARLHVRKIKPTLSQKFVLELSDGAIVDVTRGYYASFREYFRL